MRFSNGKLIQVVLARVWATAVCSILNKPMHQAREREKIQEKYTGKRTFLLTWG